MSMDFFCGSNIHNSTPPSPKKKKKERGICVISTKSLKIRQQLNYLGLECKQLIPVDLDILSEQPNFTRTFL